MIRCRAARAENGRRPGCLAIGSSRQGAVLEPATLPAVARCAGGAHRKRGMEAGHRHPERKRSGARVRRQLRDHAQGPRPDGGASACSRGGRGAVRSSTTSPPTSWPRASATCACPTAAVSCGQVRHVEIDRGHGQRARMPALAAAVADDRVYRIARVRLHVNKPFYLVEDVSLPAALFPGLIEKQECVAAHHRCWRSSTASCWARPRSASRSGRLARSGARSRYRAGCAGHGPGPRGA